MTFKDVLHIAAAFMIPLAAIEALQAWRTFRAVSEVQGLHLNPKKKKSKNKQNKPSKNSNNHDMNQNNNYQKTKSKRKIFQEKFLQKDKTSTTKNRIDPKIENPELEADPITSSENDSFSSQTCDSENLIGPAGNNDTNNNTSTKNKQNNNNINEAIFFPELDKKPPCRDYYFHQKCQKRNCTESHDLNSSIGRLIMYIARSKSCIDVCQYTLSNKFLADAILARHRLGVKIRIITDHAGANQLASQIESFHKNSIPVRTHIGNGLMHNKFIILDKKVIITGSFNFTTSAIVDNHENVVVTDQLDIVGQYVSRFEKLWGLFDYNQDKKIKG